MFWNTFIKPRSDDVAFDSKMIGPFGNCLGFSFNGDSVICPSVIGLLFWSGPFTVFRAVVHGAVFPVEGHSLWPSAHINDKVFKDIPPVANFDAKRSVVFVADVFRVIASGHHHFPRFSFSRHVGSTKVMFLFLSRVFSLLKRKASAGPGTSPFHFIWVSYFFPSALAQKKPKHAPIWCFFVFMQGGQAPKNLTRKISSFHRHSCRVPG